MKPKIILSSIKHANFIPVITIILIGFVAYFGAIDSTFLWDDYHFIINNPNIKSFTSAPKIFTQNIGSGTWTHNIYYRPIQELSYMLDYKLWKFDPKGYHLSNVILHIATALSVFFLVKQITANTFVALITSLLFTIHPINVESVAYISSRGDLLAAQ